MGTNYYVVRNRPSIEEPVHIGKNSAGWLFLFQSQNEIWRDVPVVWNSYEQVIDWLQEYTVDKPEYVIMNEYDEEIPLQVFIDIVQTKQKDPFCRDNPDNFSHARNINGYRFESEWFR